MSSAQRKMSFEAGYLEMFGVELNDSLKSIYKKDSVEKVSSCCYKFIEAIGRGGGGIVVSVLAYCSDNLSSNPADC